MDMSSAKQNMLAAGKALAIFAIVSSTLVGLTYMMTKDRIAANERQALLNSLGVLVSKDMHDNDLLKDKLAVQSPELSYRGKPVTIYRARKDHKNVAAIFDVTAPDGYNGPIRLLVAVDDEAQIIGVRVVREDETPGLGDNIELDKTNWLHEFDNRSLMNPLEKLWHVKRDGGIFDQFSGATITPRAVVKMVRKTLRYFMQNKNDIFAPVGGNQDGK